MKISKGIFRLIGVVVLIVILTRIDFGKLVLLLSRLNPLLFLSVSLIVLPAMFIKSYRWRYLLKLQGVDYSMRNSFISYIGGIGAGITHREK